MLLARAFFLDLRPASGPGYLQLSGIPRWLFLVISPFRKNLASESKDSCFWLLPGLGVQTRFAASLFQKLFAAKFVLHRNLR